MVFKHKTLNDLIFIFLFLIFKIDYQWEVNLMLVIDLRTTR